MSTPSNSQLLKNIIINRITASPQQQITFAEYMDLVLYHSQYGYYTSGTVKIGSQGDFFTASSLGSDFGELLAEQFVDMWQIMNYLQPFVLVEMGAGSGLLAADILEYLYQNYSSLFDVLEYIIVEHSEGLIEQQKLVLEKWLTKVAWKQWQEIEDSSIVGCAFSNELVDAFPVHQIVLQNKKLKEVYVAVTNETLKEVFAELSSEKLLKYFNMIDINLLSGAYRNGYRTEVNLSALNWLEIVTKKLKRGYLLTIDYGYTAQRYYNPQRYQGTLQCYYQHRRHNDPYCNIGYQDITAHVNFTALERQGELLGLEQLGFTQQALFLMALGLGDRLSQSSNSLNLQQVLHRRDALHQLIDPTGLGGFGVLIQSKGLSQEEKARALKGLTLPDF